MWEDHICQEKKTNTLLGTCDGSPNSQVVLTKGHFPTSTTNLFMGGPSPGVTIAIQGKFIGHPGELSR